MPRKHRYVAHTPFDSQPRDPSKRRFATQRQAEEFAEKQMLLVPDLELHVYKGLDGGWYLTRRQPTV